MDDQLRPVETDRAMDRALTEAGYAPLPDYVARHAGKHDHEIALLDKAIETLTQAKREYAGDYPVAARLELAYALRLIDRAYSGEAV